MSKTLFFDEERGRSSTAKSADARSVLNSELKEKDFQRVVIEFAERMGWRIHHTRPALNRRGQWSTPLQGDPGFPDLCLVRSSNVGGRVVFAELKSEKGVTSGAQERWLEQLRLSGQVEVYLWRPRDWHSGEIEQVLR